MYSRLGNPAPLALSKDENDVVTKTPVEGTDEESVTYTLYPDDWSVSEAFIDLTGNIFSSHFQKGSKPSWVESDNPLLAGLLADHYACPIKNVVINEEPEAPVVQPQIEVKA